MFSQFSVGGRPKSSQRPRVGLTMKVMKDQPQLCFSCEQLFPSRARLEDHCCPAAAFICSCGTEFSDYGDMLTHSNTHEPGHKVLDHKTIVMRRSAHMRHDQEQLRRLAAGPSPSQQSMQSAWTLAPPHGGGAGGGALMRGSPYMLSASSSSSSVGGKVNARLPALASKVNAMMLPSGSQQPQRPLLAPPAATGSPTADLWTLYQPVVVLKKADVRFNRDARFICAKCDMRFATRRELTTHHNGTHITDKVFGCIGCGVLLSSRKAVPRYHQCHASIGSSSSLKMRLITARPFAERKPARPTTAGKAANNGRIDLTRAHSAASSYRRAAQQQTPPRRSLAAAVPRPLQASARMQTEFMLANLANKATAAAMYGAGAKNKNGGFTCQICHIDFDALQMLQRHKCAKAREFVEQQLQLGKLPNRFRKLTQPSPSSPSLLAPAGKVPVYPVLHLNRNGNSKLGLAAPASMKAAFARPAPAGRKALAPVPTTTGATGEVDDDDECFIVESSPAALIAPAVQKSSGTGASVPEGQKSSSPVATVETAPDGERSSSPVVTAPDAENISSPVVTAPDAENISSPLVSVPDVEKLSSPVVSAPIAEKLSSPLVSVPDVPNLSSPVSSEPDVPNLSSAESSAPDVPNLGSAEVTAPDVQNSSSPVSPEPDAQSLSSPVAPEAPVSPASPASPIVQKFQSLNSPSPTPVQMFQSLNSSLHIVQM